jgi:hypothetical protein
MDGRHVVLSSPMQVFPVKRSLGERGERMHTSTATVRSRLAAGLHALECVLRATKSLQQRFAL